MLEVNNFLIIFSLETGGQFVGWFGVISSGITLPLSILLLIGVCIDKDLLFVREHLEEIEFERFNITDADIPRVREYLIITFVLFIVISSVYLLSSALLVRGTKKVSLTRALS